MTPEAVMLSRLQWTWVIAWHILLPAFTVGLASYIAVLEGLYWFSGREIWFRISDFWTKKFFCLVRDGRRFRHYHAVSVRYELESVYRCNCRRALAHDGL